MVKTSFGSYEQFRDFFGKAPKQVQNILFKAYPEWARRLTEEYMSACSLVYGYSQKLNGNQPLSEELSDKIRTFSEKLYD